MGNLVYKERIRIKRIRKIRLEDQISDIDSCHHIPDRDLKEEILEGGFLLNEVINWEPFTNPFGDYTGNYPPITAVEFDSCDLLILMSFNDFDKIMCEFIDKQNRYAGNTEESFFIKG